MNQVAAAVEDAGREEVRMWSILWKFLWRTSTMEPQRSSLFLAMSSAPSARGKFDFLCWVSWTIDWAADLMYYEQLLSCFIDVHILWFDRKGSKSGASMKCPGCQGSGMKVSIRQLGPSMIQQMQHPCNECKGTGETINDKDRCPQCKGEKVVQEKKVLEVVVEKGMQNGQKITFPGEADEAVCFYIALPVSCIVGLFMFPLLVCLLFNHTN